MHKEFAQLPIDNLQAGQYQPRQDFDLVSLQELAQSILSQGLLEPLLVRIIANNRYEIIAGERRWRAAKLAHLTEVPCLIGEYTDKQACALSLVENIQREDLHVLEEASAYKRLIDEFHYHQEEIAVLVGKSRSHIANSLRLLSLSEPVKVMMREQLISQGHARLLIGLNPDQQYYLANEAITKHWSVRQLEEAVKQSKHKNNEPAPKNPQRCRDVARLENLLSEQVGAPVQIVSDSDEGGWLHLKFFNNDTLAGLLERLGLRYD